MNSCAEGGCVGGGGSDGWGGDAGSCCFNSDDIADGHVGGGDDRVDCGLYGDNSDKRESGGSGSGSGASSGGHRERCVYDDSVGVARLVAAATIFEVALVMAAAEAVKQKW